MALTGVWTDGTGEYYIQQNGDDIWWVGMGPGDDVFFQGVNFTNVFHGKLDQTRNTIVGSWIDVPRGETRNSGMLTIDIVVVSAETTLAVPMATPGSIMPDAMMGTACITS